MSVELSIRSIQAQLDQLLADRYIDEPSFIGLFNFSHSKFLTWILNKIKADISAQSSENSSITYNAVGQEPSENVDVIALLEFMWLHVHGKVLRYFHLQFHQLKQEQLALQASKSNKSVTFITFKKVFAKYKKLNKLMFDFYMSIIRQVLTKYDATSKIFPKIYRFYNISFPINGQVNEQKLVNVQDEQLVSKLVYILHRILFFQGNLSRYRTLFYLYLLSSSSSMFNNTEDSKHVGFPTFDKSIDYFKLSNLLLPAFSEPLSHIGMIMNSYGNIHNGNIRSILGSFNIAAGSHKASIIVNGDKFEAVYYLVRSANQRLGNPASMDAVKSLLSSQPEEGNKLFDYFALEFKNCKDVEQELWLGSVGYDKISKNKRIEKTVKLYFLFLYSWYLFPRTSILHEILTRNNKNSRAKLGERVSKIKNSFFALVKNGLHINEKNNEILERQLIILIGSFQLLLESEQAAAQNKKIQKFEELSPLSQGFLKFTFTYIIEVFNILIIAHKKLGLKFPLSRDTKDEIKYELKNRMANYLPFLRIVLGWIRPSKVLLQYSRKHLQFMAKLAFIVNDIYLHLSLDSRDTSIEESDIFSHRYQRLRYFSEDVELRDFKPIDNFFKDFKDDFINKSRFSNLRLIGQLPSEEQVVGKIVGKLSADEDPEDTESKILRDENILRLYAIGWLSKRIIFSNSFNIMFDNEKNQFDVSKYEDQILDINAVATAKAKTFDNRYKSPENKFAEISISAEMPSNTKKTKSKKKSKKLRDTDFDEEKAQISSSHIRGSSKRSGAHNETVNKPVGENVQTEGSKRSRELLNNLENFDDFEEFEEFDPASNDENKSEGYPDDSTGSDIEELESFQEDQSSLLVSKEGDKQRTGQSVRETTKVSGKTPFIIKDLRYENMVDSLLSDDDSTLFAPFDSARDKQQQQQRVPSSKVATTPSLSSNLAFSKDIWSNSDMGTNTSFLSNHSDVSANSEAIAKPDVLGSAFQSSGKNESISSRNASGNPLSLDALEAMLTKQRPASSLSTANAAVSAKAFTSNHSFNAPASYQPSNVAPGYDVYGTPGNFSNPVYSTPQYFGTSQAQYVESFVQPNSGYQQPPFAGFGYSANATSSTPASQHPNVPQVTTAYGINAQKSYYASSGSTNRDVFDPFTLNSGISSSSSYSNNDLNNRAFRGNQ